MTYLKGTIIDGYQQERIAFRIVDYDLKSNITVMENVLIFSRRYTRYLVNKKIGNFSDKWVKAEIEDGFFETNEQEFNKNIRGKDGEFNKIGEFESSLPQKEL